jgi:hypothetical protein
MPVDNATPRGSSPDGKLSQLISGSWKQMVYPARVRASGLKIRQNGYDCVLLI